METQGIRKRGRPPKAYAAERQNAFLDHSLRRFMMAGYKGTTMEGLAASFGMSKSTIYRRYASKADLLRTAMMRNVPALAESLARVETGETRRPYDVLCDFAARIQDNHDDAGSRMMWRSVSEAHDELVHDRDEMSRMQADALAPLIAYLVDLDRRGITALGDAVRAAACFSEMVSGGLQNFLSIPPGKRERRGAMRFAVKLFLGGAATRG